VRGWLLAKMGSLESAGMKDPELAETRHLVQVVQEAGEALNANFGISSYFTRLSVDYYKTAALAVDNMVRSLDKKREVLCVVEEALREAERGRRGSAWEGIKRQLWHL
jgi:hypothetical protein